MNGAVWIYSLFPSSDWKCKEGKNKSYQGEGSSERPHGVCKAGNKSWMALWCLPGSQPECVHLWPLSLAPSFPVKKGRLGLWKQQLYIYYVE